MRWPLLAATLVLLAATPAAHANDWAKALIALPASVHTQEDPLTNPGPPGTLSDHDHGAAGSLAFGADMTTGKMLAADTTSFLKAVKSAAWAPTMVKDGVSYSATRFSYYVAAAGFDPAKIAGGRLIIFPVGLRFLIGNPHSTTLQPTSVGYWRCGGQTATLSSPPTSCPGNADFAMGFYGPQCWDGMNLDSPDHKSHVANGTADGSCPATHPVRIPQIQGEWTFPNAAIDGYLSSDHGVGPKGHSMHMDYWAVWQANFGDQLARCLNDPARNFPTAPLCGIFTYDGNPNPGGGTYPLNPWIQAMTARADIIGYVQPNGNANPNNPTAP